MSDTVSKQSYDMCEAENDNLRKHLAWAAALLSPSQRAELAKKINKDIKNGGVVEDGADDLYEELTQIKRHCVQAAELLREGIAMDPEVIDASGWYGRAEALATCLMAYDPPSPEASLRAATNTTKIEDLLK